MRTDSVHVLLVRQKLHSHSIHCDDVQVFVVSNGKLSIRRTMQAEDSERMKSAHYRFIRCGWHGWWYGLRYSMQESRKLIARVKKAPREKDSCETPVKTRCRWWIELKWRHLRHTDKLWASIVFINCLHRLLLLVACIRVHCEIGFDAG